MSWFVILPVLIPFTATALLILFRARRDVQQSLSVASSLALLVAAIILFTLVMQQGILHVAASSWQAPFGIVFVADKLSAIMVLITALISCCSVIYATANIDDTKLDFFYHPVFQVLCAALCGAFLTGDLFNLYVWFEILLIASFVLLSLGASKRQLKGAIHYVLINLVASALFLAATGLLYGLTGTLNIADIGERVHEVSPDLVSVLGLMFLVAFGMKAAIFPLFYWLPPSYATPPIAVSAMFAALLTKVGVYALLRVFTMFFVLDMGFSHNLILVLALASMLVSALAALVQDDIRKIFAYHLIAQVGMMSIGIALSSSLGLGTTVFFFLEDIVVVANLFFISGLIYHAAGSFYLSQLGGLYKAKPWLGVLFLISALSIAGFPPLSGFWAKVLLLKAALEQNHGLQGLSWTVGTGFVVTIIIITAFLSLLSMARVWILAFWKPSPDPRLVESAHSKLPSPMLFPVLLLSAVTLIISLWPEPFISLASNVAQDLVNPNIYIDAILGAGEGGY